MWIVNLRCFAYDLLHYRNYNLNLYIYKQYYVFDKETSKNYYFICG